MRASEEIRNTAGIYSGSETSVFDEESALNLMGAKVPEADAKAEEERVAILTGKEIEEDFEPWQSQLYGATIKNYRKRAGFSTAQAFSDSIYRRTRLYISRDVLYKIEQGKQNPDIAQFMAINIALFNAPFPSKVTMSCICPEWIEISNTEGNIPMEWRNENTRKLEEDTGEKFCTAADAAKAAKDDPKLFSYGSACSSK